MTLINTNYLSSALALIFTSRSAIALKPGNCKNWSLATDYIVDKLPGLSDSDASKLKLFAGHIPTNQTDDKHKLFFSLVEAEKEVGTPKLV